MTKNTMMAAGVALAITLAVYANEKHKDRLQADCHMYISAVTRSGYANLPGTPGQYDSVNKNAQHLATLLNMGSGHRDYCRF